MDLLEPTTRNYTQSDPLAAMVHYNISLVSSSNNALRSATIGPRKYQLCCILIMNRLYLLMCDALHSSSMGRANDNLFFKLGTVGLGVIGCLTLCKHRTTPITTQICSLSMMDRLHFLGYGTLHSSMDHTKYNGVV